MDSFSYCSARCRPAKMVGWQNSPEARQRCAQLRGRACGWAMGPAAAAARSDWGAGFPLADDRLQALGKAADAPSRNSSPAHVQRLDQGGRCRYRRRMPEVWQMRRRQGGHCTRQASGARWKRRATPAGGGTAGAITAARSPGSPARAVLVGPRRREILDLAASAASICRVIEPVMSSILCSTAASRAVSNRVFGGRVPPAQTAALRDPRRTSAMRLDFLGLRLHCAERWRRASSSMKSSMIAARCEPTSLRPVMTAPSRAAAADSNPASAAAEGLHGEARSRFRRDSRSWSAFTLCARPACCRFRRVPRANQKVQNSGVESPRTDSVRTRPALPARGLVALSATEPARL